MTQPSEYKAANTMTLLRLNRQAVKADYNRTLDQKTLKKHLDPAGVHVIRPMMLHEHAGGLLVAPHVRCLIFLKTVGSMEPVEGWLDIDLKEFNKLPSVKTARENGVQ